jgi:hypothetical protein
MKHDLNINNVTVSRCETVDGNGDITVDATVHVYLDPVIPKQGSWTGLFTAEFENGECVTIKNFKS